MADQFKNLMIGLFITAAIAVIIFMLMFLHPSVGNEGKILHARFTDIDKVSIGTRVTYGGKPVGEVIEIKEIGKGRSGKTDATGHLYLYDLKLRVDSGVQVFNTDSVSVRTSGLLGEKNIEITPFAPKKGEKLEEIDAEPIYAENSGSVEDAIKELKEVAGRVDDTLEAAKDLLDRARKGELVEKIIRTTENLESITNALNNPKQIEDILYNIYLFSKKINTTWEKVDSTVNNVHEVSERFSNTWDHVEEILQHLNEAVMKAKNLIGHGELIFGKVSQGEGTIGKLLVNEETYLRTSSILSKLETTLDDINHYGLLFQSDKGWQRLRARRMNLLQKLRTPQEFRNYFNDEIDQISTSISRVSMVLDNVGSDPYCSDLANDREFSKVFAELMRRVKMLEEEVRMYNTQLIEPIIHQTELGSPPLCPSGCNP
jgi:phospholipid/cholesterol/gamma-HCH transport system substrate-binding protein